MWGHRHGDAQDIEFGAWLADGRIENRLFAVDLGLDRCQRFLRRFASAEFEQAAEGAAEGAPMLAVVAAHGARLATRHLGLTPGTRIERQFQHRLQHFGVARFAPQDAANLGVDVGGDKRGDGGVMARQAEREVILQLLADRSCLAEHVAPVGENTQVAERSGAHLHQATGLDRGQQWVEKRRCVPHLRDQRLG